MPRYYFHYRNRELLADDVGQDLPDEDAAREASLKGAAELIAEQIAEGQIVDLDDEIIAEADGHVVFTVPFRNLVR